MSSSSVQKATATISGNSIESMFYLTQASEPDAAQLAAQVNLLHVGEWVMLKWRDALMWPPWADDPAVFEAAPLSELALFSQKQLGSRSFHSILHHLDTTLVREHNIVLHTMGLPPHNPGTTPLTTLVTIRRAAYAGDQPPHKDVTDPLSRVNLFQMPTPSAAILLPPVPSLPPNNSKKQKTKDRAPPLAPGKKLAPVAKGILSAEQARNTLMAWGGDPRLGWQGGVPSRVKHHATLVYVPPPAGMQALEAAGYPGLQVVLRKLTNHLSGLGQGGFHPQTPLGAAKYGYDQGSAIFNQEHRALWRHYMADFQGSSPTEEVISRFGSTGGAFLLLGLCAPGSWRPSC